MTDSWSKSDSCLTATQMLFQSDLKPSGSSEPSFIWTSFPSSLVSQEKKVYTLLVRKAQESIQVLITWEKDGQTLLHFTFPNWKLIGKASGDLGYLVESKNWVWLTRSYVTITGHRKMQSFAKYSLQQSVVKSFMQWEMRFSQNWSL